MNDAEKNHAFGGTEHSICAIGAGCATARHAWFAQHTDINIPSKLQHRCELLVNYACEGIRILSKESAFIDSQIDQLEVLLPTHI